MNEIPLVGLRDPITYELITVPNNSTSDLNNLGPHSLWASEEVIWT